MHSKATSVPQYIEELPEERKEVMNQLRNTVIDNLPHGFSEEMNYGMIGYVVPHDEYPAGYHCNPKQPLPFMNIASQKNFIAFYHLGIYANPDLMDWFVGEYPKYVSNKLDMGKSCIRFKNIKKVPFELIGQLVAKMSMQDWIELYEKNVKR